MSLGPKWGNDLRIRLPQYKSYQLLQEKFPGASNGIAIAFYKLVYWFAEQQPNEQATQSVFIAYKEMDSIILTIKHLLNSLVQITPIPSSDQWAIRFKGDNNFFLLSGDGSFRRGELSITFYSFEPPDPEPPNQKKPSPSFQESKIFAESE